MWLALATLTSIASLLSSTAPLAAVTRAAAATRPVRVSGQSPFATCTTDDPPPGTPVFPNAEVEPRLALDPRISTRAVAVWQQDRRSDGGARGLVAAHSLDGGQTWRETPLPFAGCADPASPLRWASDPWVSIGPDGTTYASAIGGDGGHSVVSVTTSHDDGVTWGNQRDVMSDDVAFDDKEAVTADPVRPGTAYLTWDRIANQSEPSPQSTWLAVTHDGGLSWSAPVMIVSADQPDTGTIGNQIVVDPRSGTLYDVFLHIMRSSCLDADSCPRLRAGQSGPQADIAMVRSGDGGATWSAPSQIAPVEDVENAAGEGGRFRTGDPLPQAAVDPSTGALFVTWCDGSFSAGRRSDVALTVSRDRGQSWSAPVRVDAVSGGPAFTPSLALGPNGRVALTYYQLRGGSGAARVDYWYRSSADAQHFDPPLHLAGPFDMQTAPYANGYFLGDYQGLAAGGGTYQALFVTTNPGNLSNRTDVFDVRISPPR